MKKPRVRGRSEPQPRKIIRADKAPAAVVAVVEQ